MPALPAFGEDWPGLDVRQERVELVGVVPSVVFAIDIDIEGAVAPETVAGDGFRVAAVFGIPEWHGSG